MGWSSVATDGFLPMFSVMMRFPYLELFVFSLGVETPTSTVPGDLQGQGQYAFSSSGQNDLS